MGYAWWWHRMCIGARFVPAVQATTWGTGQTPVGMGVASTGNTMTLSQRQTQILAALERDHEVSLWALANTLYAPEASIRRDIQALRRAGHNIAFGLGGSYRLGRDWRTPPSSEDTRP